MSGWTPINRVSSRSSLVDEGPASGVSLSRQSSRRSVVDDVTPSSPRWRISSVERTGEEQTRLTAAAIHDTIQQLQGEQGRVQKKTFTKWINAYLAKHNPPGHIDDLFTDIKDGLNLLYLLETLSGEKLPTEKGMRLQRVHYLSNISTALKFLQNRKIKLVNINAGDVVDGKPSIVLGLIWTIILYFQIEENARRLKGRCNSTRPDGAADTELQKQIHADPRAAKQMMLGWAQQTLATSASEYGVEVKDFGRSWRDGVAFNAMIDGIQPGLVDMEQVSHNPSRVNLENAFTTAEVHLGIPRLLDPEDVDVDKPDERSIMTYVAQFMEKFSSPDTVQLTSDTQSTSPEQRERLEYESLLEWTNHASELLMVAASQPIIDRHLEYQAFKSFADEMQSKSRLRERFRTKAASDKLLYVSNEQWQSLDSLWVHQLQGQVKNWQQKLDCSLPGRLGAIATWLYGIKQLLEANMEPSDDSEKMVESISSHQQKIKCELESLEPYQREFQLIISSDQYQDENLSQKQINNIALRLHNVSTQADITLGKLEYDKSRYQLMVVTTHINNLINVWQSTLFGSQLEAEAMLADYQKYVKNNQLFARLDSAFHDIGKTAENCCVLSGNNPAVCSETNAETDKSMATVTATKTQLQAVSSQLEEIVNCWDTYSELLKQFTEWLDDMETCKTPISQQEFTNTLKQLIAKLELFKSSGEKVVERAKEMTRAEIRAQVASVQARLQVAQRQQQRLRETAVESAKKDFWNKLENIHTQVHSLENFLTQPVKYEDLVQHSGQLNIQRGECEKVVRDLDSLTALIQSTSMNTPQHVVDSMTHELSATRRTVTQLTDELTRQRQAVKLILPDVKTVTTAVDEVSKFLQDWQPEITEKPNTSWTQTKTTNSLTQHQMNIENAVGYNEQLKLIAELPLKAQRHLTHLDVQSSASHIHQLNTQLKTNLQDAAVHVEQLEFIKASNTFHEAAAELERQVSEQHQILQQNPQQYHTVGQKHKLICESELQHICDKSLRTMSEKIQRLQSMSGNVDVTLQQSAQNAQQRSRQLKTQMTKIETALTDIPTKLQLYSSRLQKFEHYMNELQSLKATLSRDDLSAEEYQAVLARYQELLSCASEYELEAKWLQEAARDFGLKNSPSDISRLQAAVGQFESLLPVLSSTLTTASQVAPCIEFRDSAAKQLSRLKGMETDIKKQLETCQTGFNDMDNIRANIDNCEVVLAQLNEQSRDIEREIMRGRTLMQQNRDVPTFVHDTVSDLSETLSSMTSLVQTQQTSAKEVLKNWEEFESSLQGLQDLVDNARVLATQRKPLDSHEAIKDELIQQMEFIDELTAVDNETRKLCALKGNLSRFVSTQRERQMSVACVEMATESCQLIAQVRDRIKQLERLSQQWNDIINRQEAISMWISDKETKLCTVTGQQQLSALIRIITDESLMKEKELDELVEICKCLTVECKTSSQQLVLCRNLSNLQQRLAALRQSAVDKSQFVELLNEISQQLDSQESWLTRRTSELDKMHSVNVDNVQTACTELQTISTECQQHLVNIAVLECEIPKLSDNQESNDKMKAVEIQRRLSSRTHLLTKSCVDMSQLADSYRAVLSDWLSFSREVKQISDVVSEIQQKLLDSSHDVSHQELTSLDVSLRQVRTDLTTLQVKCSELSNRMSQNHIVVVSGTPQQQFELELECSSLLKAVEKICVLLEQKRDRQERMASSWSDFEHLKEGILHSLASIRQQVESITVSQPILAAVELVEKALSLIKIDLVSVGQRYEEMRRLGRSLMALDGEDHADEIQDALMETGEQWEVIQRSVTDLRSRVMSVMLRWKLYNESAGELEHILEQMKSITDRGVVVHSDTDARTLLHCYANAEVEFSKHKRHLLSLKSRSSQLADEVDSLPGLKASFINSETERWNCQCDDTAELLAKNRETLEQFVSQFDEINRSINELETRLKDKLNTLQHHSDVTDYTSHNAAEHLGAYQQERPQTVQMFEKIANQIDSLTSLNSGHEISTLTDRKSTLSQTLTQLDELTSTLCKNFADFDTQRTELGRQLQEVFKLISTNMETLDGLSDTSGTDDNVLAQLSSAQMVFSELQKSSLLDSVSAARDKLSQSYIGADLKSFDNDWKVLKTKLASSRENTFQVCAVLRQELEHRAEGTLRELQQWLTGSQQKLSWCRDVTGSCSDIESKLSALAELTESLDTGNRLRNLASQKLQQLKGSLSLETKTRLEKFEQRSEQQWTELVNSLDATRDKLQETRLKCDAHLVLCKELSSWLGHVESNVKLFNSLTSTFDEQQQHISSLQQLQRDVNNRERSFSELNQTALQLFTLTSDNHIVNSSQQLQTKYDSLGASLNCLLEKQQKNVKDYLLFTESVKVACSWLTERKHQLLQMSTNEQFTEENVKNIQKLESEKSVGQKLVDNATCNGEKLYKSTSQEGREIVRQQLYKMQDEWESYCSELSDAVQNAVRTRHLFVEHSRQFTEIGSWFDDIKLKLDADVQTCSLQQKRAALQAQKILCREVASYESVINSLEEMMQSFRDTNLHNDMTKLMQDYKCTSMQVQLKLEQRENEHKCHVEFNELSVKWHSWLCSFYNQLETINRQQSTDQQFLLKQLDILNSLISSREEWNNEMLKLDGLAEQVLSQTSSDGQKQIVDELKDIHSGWENSARQTEKTRNNLQSLLAACESFDLSCNQVLKCLEECDKLLSQQELPVTFDEIGVELNKLLSLKERLLKEKETIKELKSQELLRNDLQRMSIIEGMSDKCHSLLNKLTDAISASQQSIQYHEAYSVKCISCAELLNNIEDQLNNSLQCSMDLTSTHTALNNLKNLSSSQLQADSLIRELSDVEVKLTNRLAPSASSVLHQQTLEFTKRVNTFSSKLSDAIHQFELLITQLSTYEDSCHRFSEWMSNTREQVDSCGHQATLSNKKSLLQTYEVLLQDVVSHKSLLTYLSDHARSFSSSPAAGGSNASSRLTQLTKDYSVLSDDTQKFVERLQKAVDDHQALNDLMTKIQVELENMKTSLEFVLVATGDKVLLQRRLQSQQDMTRQLEQINISVDELLIVANDVLNSTTPAGQNIIQEDIANIQQDRDRLQTALLTAGVNINNGLQRWEEFNTEQQQLTDWLQNTEQQLKRCEQNSLLAQKLQQLTMLQEMIKEIEAKSSEFNDFVTTADVLSELSKIKQVETSAATIAGHCQSLLSTTKECEKKQSSIVQDWSTYQRIYDKCSDQLEAVKQICTENSSTVGDKQAVYNKLLAIKSAARKLEETRTSVDEVVKYKHKLDSCCLLTYDCQQIETETSKLHSDQESLVKWTSDITQQLEAQLAKWDKYNKLSTSLEQWIDSAANADKSHGDINNPVVAWTENSQLASDMSTSSNVLSSGHDLVNQIGKLERLRLQQSAICRAEEHAQELTQLVSELSTDLPRDMSVESMTSINNSLAQQKHNLQLQLATLAADHERHQKYLDATSRCEKWLLHMSMILTDHSNICTCSQCGTSTSLSKHLQLLEEIQGFEVDINEVVDSGHQLLTTSHENERFKHQIETQIANVNNMYGSLKTAALHVKQRLTEADVAWQKLTQLLTDCQGYIDSQVTVFVNSECNTLDSTARHQQQITLQEMLRKLQEYMKGIEMSCKDCNSYIWSTTDEHSRTAQTQLQQTADSINNRLRSAISTLQQQLETINMQHRVDSTKQQLNGWLNDKKIELEQHPDNDSANLQKLLCELLAKETVFASLTTDLSGLPNIDVDEHVAPLKQCWLSLLENTKTAINSNASSRQHTNVNSNTTQSTDDVTQQRHLQAAGSVQQSDSLPSVYWSKQHPSDNLVSSASETWLPNDDTSQDHLQLHGQKSRHDRCGFGLTSQPLSLDVESGYGESTLRSASVDQLESRDSCDAGNDGVLRGESWTELHTSTTDLLPTSWARDNLRDPRFQYNGVSQFSDCDSVSSSEGNVLRAIHEADLALRLQHSTMSASGTPLHGSSRHHSISIEHPVKIIVIDDKKLVRSGSMEQSDVESLSGGHEVLTRVNVVLDDDYDDDRSSDYDLTARKTAAGHHCVVFQGESRDRHVMLPDGSGGEMIWSPDGSNVELETQSGKYEMEVIEQESTRISTILVPNTSLDTSSEEELDKDDDKQREDGDSCDAVEQVAAGHGDTMASWRSFHTSQQFSEHASSVTCEHSTQTIQDQTTQTDMCQGTQTDEQMCHYGCCGHDDCNSLLTATHGHGVDQRLATSQDLSTLQHGNSSHSVTDCRHRHHVGGVDVVESGLNLSVEEKDDAASRHKVDFSQQTITHTSTQTPVRLRLGVDGRLLELPRGSLMTLEGSELSNQLLGTRWNSDIAAGEFDVLPSHDFGTQTFGQLTPNVLTDTETQTMTSRHGGTSRHSVKGRSTDDNKHSKHRSHHRHHSGSIEQYDHSVEHSSNHSHHRSKHRRDKENDSPVSEAKHRSSKSSVRQNGTESELSARSSCADDSRKELLKLMLHQIKDLKDRASSQCEAEQNTTRKSHSHHKSHENNKKNKKQSSRHRSKSDQLTERQLSQQRLQLLYRDQDKDIAGQQRHRRRHSIESYISENTASDGRHLQYQGRSRYFDRGGDDHRDLQHRGRSVYLDHGENWFPRRTSRIQARYRSQSSSPIRHQGQYYSTSPSVFNHSLQPPQQFSSSVLPAVPMHNPTNPADPSRYSTHPSVPLATHVVNTSGTFRPISQLAATPAHTSPIIFVPETAQTDSNQPVQPASYLVLATPQNTDRSSVKHHKSSRLSSSSNKKSHRQSISSSHPHTQLALSLEPAEREATKLKNITAALKKHSRTVDI